MIVFPIIGMLLGVYLLSFYVPQEETLKERPLPPVEKIPQYENKVLGLGQSCGPIDGNCIICLGCFDSSGSLLAKEDFKENSGKSGACNYLEKGSGDELCTLPIKRCDGAGNCVKCFKDEDCGECSRCAINFYALPGKISLGECIPIETKNNQVCNSDISRDSFYGIGICSHGKCLECLADSDCPSKFICQENSCVI